MSLKSAGLVISTIRMACLLTLFLLTQNVHSHHSAAMFDLETIVEIEGTVEKFQWTNPHVWLHVSTADKNGEPVRWKIEHVAPAILKRQGWKRTSFRKGDKISITFYPAKSGKPKGGFIRAVTADGTKLGKEGSETHPELLVEENE